MAVSGYIVTKIIIDGIITTTADHKMTKALDIPMHDKQLKVATHVALGNNDERLH